MDRLPLDAPFLIGVVHLLPLPGAPRHATLGGGSMDTVLERAVLDARALAAGGCTALLVENFGDAPFYKGAVPPETVAAMTLGVAAVRDAVRAEVAGLPLGVNVLRNDLRAALGIAAATGAAFARVNVHTGVAVTDQGLVEGAAAETVRERARLCPQVAILADVHVKHAVPLGGGAVERAAADTLERGLADALILSGEATGAAPDVTALRAVRARLPHARLVVGSGLTDANAPELLGRAGRERLADGAIVGTWLKRGGRVSEPVELERVRALRRVLDGLP